MAEIEVKFTGQKIKELKGAPAEVVADSLYALQRIVYLIGMNKEGQVFSSRVKPSAKVRNEYAVICKPPESGSHLQPVLIANRAGRVTQTAIAAQSDVLAALKAFGSGNQNKIAEAIPSPRLRWFIADAALGLIPEPDSGIDVSIRLGRRGRYAFHAQKSRKSIEMCRQGKPPAPSDDVVSGKLKVIDFAKTVFVLQPTYGVLIRIQYPLHIEQFLQKNVRKKLIVYYDRQAQPQNGVFNFQNVKEIYETESNRSPLERITANSVSIVARRPLRYQVFYDAVHRVFRVRNEKIGLDAFCEDFDSIESCVIDDISVLWSTYAGALDSNLTDEAQELKKALIDSFEEVI